MDQAGESPECYGSTKAPRGNPKGFRTGWDVQGAKALAGILRGASGVCVHWGSTACLWRPLKQNRVSQGAEALRFGVVPEGF